MVAEPSTIKRLEASELAKKIPGWGVDAKGERHPGLPQGEKTPGTPSDLQEAARQIPQVRIHKSSEKPELTPVFGTTCPPRGLSGFLRDLAYTYSEGRNAHWLILMFADRVDVLEGRLLDLLHLRLFNPLAEAGLAVEWTRDGLRSRLGQRRDDLARLGKELSFIAGAAAFAWWLGKQLLKALNPRTNEGVKKAA